MLDSNATNFLTAALTVDNIQFSVHNGFDSSLLGEMFIPWGRVKVSEIASGEKTSEHEWDRKQEKFNFFRDVILRCEHFDTTLFVVRNSEKSPYLIIDGVHRAIGIQKALAGKPELATKINLRILLIESPNMSRLSDYQKVL